MFRIETKRKILCSIVFVYFMLFVEKRSYIFSSTSARKMTGKTIFMKTSRLTKSTQENYIQTPIENLLLTCFAFILLHILLAHNKE